MVFRFYYIFFFVLLMYSGSAIRAAVCFNAIDTNTLLTREEVKQQFAFAIKIKMGGSLISFNDEKSQYFDQKIALDNGFGIALHKWNIEIGWTPNSYEINRDIFIQNQSLESKSKFTIIRNYLNLGYSLDILPRFSIEPKIGVTRIKNTPHTDIEKNLFFRTNRTTGIDLGITLNLYTLFKNEMAAGKGFPYYTWFLSFEQNFIDYSTIHPNFGSNSYVVSFGFAFKPYLYLPNHKKRGFKR